MAPLPHPDATDWLLRDWRLLMPLAEPVLALVAVMAGAIVGAERQKSGKPAGLRTLILVCLGSAVFTLISFAFGTPADATRIVAQIVTGIGFLGGGVILRTHGNVSGATTAATIWTVAAIGVVAGNGYAGAAICLSLMVRFILGTISFYENRIAGELELRSVVLEFDPAGGKTKVRIERVLVDFHRVSVTARWEVTESESAGLTLDLKLPRRSLCELLDILACIPEVRSIKEIHKSSVTPGASKPS